MNKVFITTLLLSSDLYFCLQFCSLFITFFLFNFQLCMTMGFVRLTDEF